MAAALDLTSRETIAAALRAAVLQFGGFDVVDQHRGDLSDAGSVGAAPKRVWARTLQINVTSNYVLAQEAAQVLQGAEPAGVDRADQLGERGRAEGGSEAYDVSKAAINHLIRELAIGLGPLVRVNGIAPATVIAGSSMFPRDRVIVALQKYNIAFDESESTEELRDEAGGVLRAADDHAPADSADRQRERDLLAGRRPEREDDRPRHPGRRRAAGGVSAMTYVLRAGLATMRRADCHGRPLRCGAPAG